MTPLDWILAPVFLFCAFQTVVVFGGWLASDRGTELTLRWYEAASPVVAVAIVVYEAGWR